jgi:hypothetical protein
MRLALCAEHPHCMNATSCILHEVRSQLRNKVQTKTILSMCVRAKALIIPSQNRLRHPRVLSGFLTAADLFPVLSGSVGFPRPTAAS